jgi:16S rRNA C1402 (ribose-2'-O) methylase RsmI
MEKSSNKNVIFFNKRVCFNCFAPRKAKKTRRNLQKMRQK